MERLDLEMRVMSSSGNSILKGMSPIEPMLDLFVRESIQNSYDALLPNEKTLREEFDCGDFDALTLADKFEGISFDLKLKAKFLDSSSYIAVRDYNATGLTGPTRVEDIENQQWGKFLNLVRNFGKSQKEAGSGGSWGYGKTTFYKIGLGIVIYYSRIKEQNQYIERLMACLVESENDRDGLLYKVQEGKNTGIAWWGKKNGREIDPITDHNEIMEILNCFNYKPYENEETGTAVIIPYIDKTNLLNQTSTGNYKDNTLASWAYSLEDYIKIAVQKWYPTKCNNTTSKINGIDAYINGVKIEKLRPLFKTIQNMYRQHYGETTPIKYEQVFINYKITPIFNSKTAGFLYYKELDESELLMDPPNNEPSPFTFVTNEKDDGTNKKVIVCFCRKPGMILKYDINGDWAGSIKPLDPNKYLICFFIANSDNEGRLEGQKITIDDYLRASESAEHNNWKDISEYTFFETGKKVDCSKVKLVNTIQRRIRETFEELLPKPQEDTQEFVGSALNKKLASLFLPKDGFGHKPITPPPGGDGSGKKQRRSKIEFSPLQVLDGIYRKQFQIMINKNNKKIDVIFKINTESSDIDINEWEELLELPFQIDSLYINEIKMKDDETISIDKITRENDENEYYKYIRKMSNKGNQYGFSLEIVDEDVLSINGDILYQIYDPTIPISITQGKGE